MGVDQLLQTKFHHGGLGLASAAIDCPTSCYDCWRFADAVPDRYNGSVMAPPPRSDMTTIEPVTVPLREDPPGVYRVGETRVLLEVVIHAFRCGATPETIVQSYDTLSLPDVYAVLAYCLTHREQIDEYMRRCDSEAVHVRNRVQASQPDQSDVRERLMQRAKGDWLATSAE